MSFDNESALALKADAPRRFLVAPLQVQKEGKNNRPIPSTAYPIYVPLALDGTGPHYSHATAWNQLVLRTLVSPFQFIFQLMIMWCEVLDQEGGSICKVNPDKNPTLYGKMVHVTAKARMGKMQVSERDYYKKFVKRTKEVNLRFEYDVAYEMKRIQAVADASKKARMAKPGEDDEEEAEEEPEEEKKNGRKRARPKAPIDDGTYAVRLTGTEMNDGDNDHVFDAFATKAQLATWYDEFSNVLDYVSNRVYKDRISSCERVPDQMVLLKEYDRHVHSTAVLEEAVAAAAGDKSVPDLEPKTPYMGPEGDVPKIIFSVTAIPSKDDPSVVAGMMACFTVMDNALNPGLFFDKVVENAKNRNNNRLLNRAIGTELFPEYAAMFGTNHPCGNYTNLDRLAGVIAQIRPDLVAKHNGSFNDFRRVFDHINNSEESLRNVMTPMLAIKVLTDAGGDPDILGTMATWYDVGSRTAQFPQSKDAPTYKYAPEQVFWVNTSRLGLSEQFFPFVNTEQNYLERLIIGDDMDTYIKLGKFVNEADAMKAVREEVDGLNAMLVKELVVTRSSMQKYSLIDYNTQNDFIHRREAAKMIYKRIDSYYPSHYEHTLSAVQKLVFLHGDNWRKYADKPLQECIAECEKYNKILELAQTQLTTDFASLWQLDGDVDALNISEPVKAMLKYYRKARWPNMTRPLIKYDPELDLFGNSMLQQLMIYSWVARILQPMICMVSEGLFSAYYHDLEELSFNMICHGRYDTGKTFTAIKTLIKFTCLPGTVDAYSLSSGSADTTHKHVYDSILACDECPRIMTSQKEADKNPEQESKEKLKMTSGKLEKEVFTFVDGVGKRKIRWTERVRTDCKRAGVWVTNDVVEGKRALSSRMYRITVKQTTLPANEMNSFLDANIDTDSRTFLRINQFLSACAYKAAAVGAILPDPSLELFDQVSNVVIASLKEWKHIQADVGPRSLDIMRPYVRQLVYKHAIRCAFDMPFSPNYEKPFSAADICAIQPYCYVTTSMIWWTWTALASEWIEDDNTNVINALLSLTGVEWKDEESPYLRYENDIHDKLPWRKRHNPNVVQAKDSNKKDANQFLVDLQYFEISGTEQHICTQVAARTFPRMSVTDVGSVLHRMEECLIKPVNGGIKPQPKQTFADWHKKKKEGGKRRETEAATGPNVCPAEYNPDPDNYSPTGFDRTEAHVEKLEKNAVIPVIDTSELATKGKLYFTPHAISIFKQNVITKALQHATVTLTTPPGKTLLGFVNTEDPTRVTVYLRDKEDIIEDVNEIDMENGWKMGPNNQPVYTRRGVPEESQAISRRKGIVFNRRGALDKVELDCLMAVPLAPVAKGDRSWEKRYENAKKLMSTTQEIIPDLDVYSATLQHMRCGRPLDEPVRTPAWINAQYEANRGDPKYPLPLDKGLDYPHDLNACRKKLAEKWIKGQGIGNSDAVATRISARRDKKSALSRAERNLLVREREQQNNESALVESPHKKPRNANAVHNQIVHVQRRLGESN